jgi:DNA replication and repair protein RecF
VQVDAPPSAFFAAKTPHGAHLRIQRFTSAHFRNLEHDTLAFAPGVNLLIGENGQGKTNILEAIYFFKFGRSFRTGRDAEVIRFDEPFCRVEVSADYATGDSQKFAVSIERTGTKRIKVDDSELSRYSELVGRYPIVVFGPDDLEIVSGYPAERRRFLDMVGSMTNPVYLDNLKAYRRVLHQRNAAYKARRPEEAQGVWTEELIRRGCALVAQREALVDSLREELKPHTAALAVAYPVAINYESELTANRPPTVTCEEQFAARLAAVEVEEARRRTTLVGPHRDDLGLSIDGRDLRKYGSQGQRRLVAVLLKLAELSYLEKNLAERCVLLLDDLFSELDSEITAKLKRHLDGGRQIFVTSPIETKWVDGTVWYVSDGKIRGGTLI